MRMAKDDRGAWGSRPSTASLYLQWDTSAAQIRDSIISLLPPLAGI